MPRFFRKPGWPKPPEKPATQASFCWPTSTEPYLVVGQFEKTAPSGAKEAAEKWGSEGESPKKLPSGPKGHDDLVALAARVNSCPFKTSSFSAAYKAPVY
jgi:hypothetical protein